MATQHISRVDEDLSIKVADFGLARDIYSTEYYRVEQHVTLPVKWMPLESLMDGYFDEKTDVVRDHTCLDSSKNSTSNNLATNRWLSQCIISMHVHVHITIHFHTNSCKILVIAQSSECYLDIWNQFIYFKLSHIANSYRVLKS